MVSDTQLHEYENHDALIKDFAVQIISRLEQAIKNDGRASLALSGGSTPKPLLQYLSQQQLEWPLVDITLVDERCVDNQHPRSNAKLVDTHLLSQLSQQAKFFPLYPESADKLQQLKQPFDVCILGMGTDGHTASFFPDADNLLALLDENDKPSLKRTQSASSLEERISWNLSALLQAKYLALHITGVDKHQVLQQAMQYNQVEKWPVCSVIHQGHSPLSIYYSPES